MRQILLEYAGGDSVRQSGKRLHGAVRLMAVTALLTLGWLPVVHAGNPVVIRIKTKPSAPIAAGFSGFNTPQPRNGVEYYDPKFVAAATPLRAGWVRYPAGRNRPVGERFDRLPAAHAGKRRRRVFRFRHVRQHA